MLLEIPGFVHTARLRVSEVLEWGVWGTVSGVAERWTPSKCKWLSGSPTHVESNCRSGTGARTGHVPARRSCRRPQTATACSVWPWRWGWGWRVRCRRPAPGNCGLEWRSRKGQGPNSCTGLRSVGLPERTDIATGQVPSPIPAELASARRNVQ